ncbi:MAG: mechanosensitive ion channel family protein [Bacteroidales bacterium]
MKEFLQYPIFEFDKYTFKVANIVGLIVLIAVFMAVLYTIKSIIYRSRKIDIAKKYAFFKLIKYFLTVIVIVSGIRILGFDISILLAGSAALLVGIGLGIQNIFSDFISGIIILIDSSIKVSDIIEVNGMVCRVQEINFRTTTVLTRDDKYIILPNSELTRSNLINWTHSKTVSRFEISVGVDYSSNIHDVMRILEETAMAHQHVLKKPKPFVRFNDYADSALIFTLYFWAEEVFRVENTKSELRIMIFDAFKAKNIQIPFPQRVIHINQK